MFEALHLPLYAAATPCILSSGTSQQKLAMLNSAAASTKVAWSGVPCRTADVEETLMISPIIIIGEIGVLVKWSSLVHSVLRMGYVLLQVISGLCCLTPVWEYDNHH